MKSKASRVLMPSVAMMLALCGPSGALAQEPSASPAGPAASSAECATLEVERQKAQREMAASIDELNKLVSSFSPMAVAASSSATSAVGSIVAGAASALLPGVGDLVGKGVSAAKNAAHQGRLDAIQTKALAMGGEQQIIGQRLAELETRHASQCTGVAMSPSVDATRP